MPPRLNVSPRARRLNAVGSDQPSAVAACPVHQGSAGTRWASRFSPGPDVYEQARNFLEMFYRETNLAGLSMRWGQVREEIRATGTWWQTQAELTFGARVAWRQSGRCIGRVRWHNLIVRDARSAATTDQVFENLVDHLALGTNGGKIRSVVTIFAPDVPGVGPRTRIWNDQLIRYAGWKQPDGSVLGDGRYVAFTDLVTSLGWRQPQPPDDFTVLPLVIETSIDEPTLYDLPADQILEVDIRHPKYPWFAELGLRWHAVPVMSNLRLQIGGVSYSAAPFNGFYVAAEIASRNLADRDRYDVIPEVARRLGLDTGQRHSLWWDEALVVVNQAVLHSFGQAGVTVSDHHTESELFRSFAEREEAAGRVAYGDWSWLNSYPMTPQDPSWNRYYADGLVDPYYWLDAHSARLVAEGVVPDKALVDLQLAEGLPATGPVIPAPALAAGEEADVTG
jgi:nitric-oxide synthase, bacterial